MTTPGWAPLMVKHYQGDDSDLRVLLGGVTSAFGDQRRRLRRAGGCLLRTTREHPTLGRGYGHVRYAPMVELLRYLEANGFTNYIARAVAATSCARSRDESTASRRTA